MSRSNRLALARVIVAHRPETIVGAGRVLVLEQGRIAQDLRSQPVPAAEGLVEVAA